MTIGSYLSYDLRNNPPHSPFPMEKQVFIPPTEHRRLRYHQRLGARSVNSPETTKEDPISNILASHTLSHPRVSNPTKVDKPLTVDSKTDGEELSLENSQIIQQLPEKNGNHDMFDFIHANSAIIGNTDRKTSNAYLNHNETSIEGQNNARTQLPNVNVKPAQSHMNAAANLAIQAPNELHRSTSNSHSVNDPSRPQDISHEHQAPKHSFLDTNVGSDFPSYQDVHDIPPNLRSKIPDSDKALVNIKPIVTCSSTKIQEPVRFPLIIDPKTEIYTRNQELIPLVSPSSSNCHEKVSQGSLESFVDKNKPTTKNIAPPKEKSPDTDHNSDLTYHNILKRRLERINKPTTYNDGSKETQHPDFLTPNESYLAEKDDLDIETNRPGSPTWMVSDILQSIGSGKEQKDSYHLISRGNDLVSLLRSNPSLKENLIIKSFINRILYMLSHKVLEVRATGYRIVRYVMSDFDSLRYLVHSKILIFIIISMSRKNCYTEKEQALLLLREFYAIPEGDHLLSVGVVKSIIAIVENEDVDPLVENQGNLESFSNMCMETILELALINAELIFLSGGFRVIFKTLHEGPMEIAMMCLSVLTIVLDNQNSRKFLRGGYDMSSLVAHFADFDNPEIPANNATDASDTDESSDLNKTKHERCAFFISMYLKTWNGLTSFAHRDFESWKVLVSSLTRRNNAVKSIVLDLFFDLLRIEPMAWIQDSSISDILSRFTQRGEYQLGNVKYSDSTDDDAVLERQYLGTVVLILVMKCDILPILLTMMQDNQDKQLPQRAARLVSCIYKLSDELLPIEYLLSRSSILPFFEKLNLRQNNIINYRIEGAMRDLDEEITPHIANSEKLTQVKLRLNKISVESVYQIEESDLKLKIVATKVLAIKEYNDWNWRLLEEIVGGPLSNPRKFEEIVKGQPKFLKRLMSFYRPFKFRFSTTTKFRGSLKYIITGSKLIESLLLTPEGYKYLSSNKILPQISEIFAQVDPFSGILAKEPMLTKQRLKETLSSGYINFLAVLSKKEVGIKLLEQWQFFSIFHHLIEGSVSNLKNNYLISMVLTKMDYTIDSQFRIVLAKALTICSADLKVSLITTVLLPLMGKPECERWVVMLFIQRLFDSKLVISEIAINALLDYCRADETNLIYVILKQPSVNILKKSEKGRALLSKFLSTVSGFKFLDDIGYIQEEFRQWVNLKNVHYSNYMNSRVESFMYPYLVPVVNISPPGEHFFTCLLQTEEGMLFFQNNYQYLEDLIHETEKCKHEIEDYFRFHGKSGLNNQGAFALGPDKFDHSLVQILKQHLWTLGSIAGSLFGIQLVDPECSRNLSTAIIPMMIDLTTNFPIWHVRRIALQQLAKVASTVEGAEILDDHNWVLMFDKYENPKGLCYPKSDDGFEQIFQVEISNPYDDRKYQTLFGQNTDHSLDEQFDPIIIGEGDDIIAEDFEDTELREEDYTRYENRVLSLMNHLSVVLNRIERKAFKELERIKTTFPEVFKSTALFLKVVRQIDKGHYKLKVRQFVFKLFLDGDILEALVKQNRRLRHGE